MHGCTIEGRLKVGPRPGINETVLLSGESGLQFNFEDFKVATDAEGRFVMANVPAGDRKLVRLIPIGDRSWGHSHMQNVTVKAGEVTTVSMGGDGQAVTGSASGIPAALSVLKSASAGLHLGFSRSSRARVRSAALRWESPFAWCVAARSLQKSSRCGFNSTARS